MNEPRRGEVWMVDLGMTAKVRPCLVISIGATEQERALATLVPHTTSIRNSRFEVNPKVRFLREGVFDAQSLVTIPHAKLIRKMGTLSMTRLAEVERAAAKWLREKLVRTPQRQRQSYVFFSAFSPARIFSLVMGCSRIRTPQAL